MRRILVTMKFDTGSQVHPRATIRTDRLIRRRQEVIWTAFSCRRNAPSKRPVGILLVAQFSEGDSMSALIKFLGVCLLAFFAFTYFQKPLVTESLQYASATNNSRIPVPMPRSEFRGKIMGLSPDEVVAAIGKPDDTQELFPGEPTWIYLERTSDPITGKVDKGVIVMFRHERVYLVSYP